MKYLNAALCRYHTVHRALGEGIETSVRPSHEVRLQKVSRGAVVLEFSLVQLHRQIGRLEI